MRLLHWRVQQNVSENPVCLKRKLPRPSGSRSNRDSSSDEIFLVLEALLSVSRQHVRFGGEARRRCAATWTEVSASGPFCSFCARPPVRVCVGAHALARSLARPLSAMSAWRGAALLGAAVTLSGGLAFLLYTLSSSSSSSSSSRKKRPSVRAERVPESSRPNPESSARSEVRSSGSQVLVLGLDGAGKTSLLHYFAGNSLDQDVTPTEGFNAVSITKEDFHVEFLEIGGTENLRSYWKKYLCKAQVLVYVVDSSDAKRFPLAKKHLHELIAGDPHLALVILANKQDVVGACGITELHEALSLAEVGDERKLFLIGTYIKKGDSEIPSSVQDARDLIFHMVTDSR